MRIFATNKLDAQKVRDICQVSGFVPTPKTTRNDVREYFTVESFNQMFPGEGHNPETLKRTADYLISVWRL